MFEGLLLYATISLLIGLPAYATGWLVLRVLGRNVESLSAWWSRTISPPGKRRRTAILTYEQDGREIFTAEWAAQVGCLFWVSLLVLLPLGIWFVVSPFE